MYTIEKDFSQKKYSAKVIKAIGRDFQINYSSILSELIQKCGIYCEYYASDLFITWQEIDQQIENKTIKTSTHLFGIRENGVDHNTFILTRYNNYGENARYEYRKIYRLDIEVEAEKIKMELYEIEKPYTERKVC